MKMRTANYLEIEEAQYVSGYKLRLSFNDGTSRLMDFEPFLRKAMNPQVTKYRQLRNFKKFHLCYGDLMWGDFEMIFPIEDLHHGDILHGKGAGSTHSILSETAVTAGTVSRRKAKTVSYKKAAKRK